MPNLLKPPAARKENHLISPPRQPSLPTSLLQAGQGEFVAKERSPYQSELDYFKANPRVGGMAAEDGLIIINPYSALSDAEKNAVRLNEAARLYMRMNGAPGFALTDEQRQKLIGTGYENMDPGTQAATIAARIMSGDPSGGAPTPEQRAFVEALRGKIRLSPSR